MAIATKYLWGGTSFSGVRLTSAEEGNEIFIGKECLFSYNIDLRNTDSHEIYENGVIINKGKKVVIKDKVWIGEGVSILKGVTINEGNIIGAGTVITKSVLEKNVIIAGNPAKIVRRNIEWRK